MAELQRLTTEYIDYEDRIRLTGEAEDGTRVIWLTRRLMDRVIPHLTLWLEQEGGCVPRADLLLSFAQQAAQSNLIPQPPVLANADSTFFLAQEVDIGTGPDSLLMSFKNGNKGIAAIRFTATALRQWLGIVHQAYIGAPWPVTVWPTWMTDSVSPHPAQVLVWH